MLVCVIRPILLLLTAHGAVIRRLCSAEVSCLISMRHSRTGSREDITGLAAVINESHL